LHRREKVAFERETQKKLRYSFLAAVYSIVTPLLLKMRFPVNFLTDDTSIVAPLLLKSGIVTQMDDYDKMISSFREFVTSSELVRKAAYPTIKSASDGSPRSTKFGGMYPQLPSESHRKCDLCDQPLMMIVQLYVPTLPDFIQSQFPPQSRDQLIVLGVCPQCLGSNGHYIASYSGDQLDRLVYHPDVGEKWKQREMRNRRRFPQIPNSPPVYDTTDDRRCSMDFCAVGGWVEADMVPNATVTKVRQQLEDAQIEVTERIFIAAHDINMENGLAAVAYLGGWPHFCGEDQSPGSDFVLLLSLCESEAATLEWGNAGTAQIWMGVNSKAGAFKFTCSSY
jgi:hypothetical protein